jgi:hypothetical protein
LHRGKELAVLPHLGVRQVAAQARVDHADLTRILAGMKRPSRTMLAKLDIALAASAHARRGTDR